MTVILGNYSTDAMYSVEKSTKGRVEQREAGEDRSMTPSSLEFGFNSMESCVVTASHPRNHITDNAPAIG